MPYTRAGSKKQYIRVGRVRVSAGTESREDAAALEAKLNHELWLTQRMGVKPRHSWKEAAVRWCKEKAHKETIDRDIEKLKWLDRHLGGVSDIDSITRERIDRVLQDRAGVSTEIPKSANSTANRYVALISSILYAAEREWAWGSRAPTLRRYPEPKDEQRWLTVQEWKRLSLELPSHLRLAATFSISTGLRESKVFGLKWSAVDLMRCSLNFTGTENKLGNSIPLNATAIRVLTESRSLAAVSLEHVFLYNGHPIQQHGPRAWRSAFERAEIEYMKWHGLRGTFNSWLAQAGVPREIRMRLVGHTTGEIHDRYTHLAVEHLRPYSAIIDTLLVQQTGESEASA